MKITFKGDYALKAILDLSRHYGLKTVTINEIAARIDAPVKFLEQVLLELKKGGFVESRRGKIGGYLLARPPGKIKLGEVIRFIDGPIEPLSCISQGYPGCNDIYKCVFRNIWQRVFQATSDIVDHVTFEDLIAQADSAQEIQSYSI